MTLKFVSHLTSVGTGARARYTCECGSLFETLKRKVDSGAVRSCGCLRVESNRSRCTKHGASKTPMYRVWWEMKARCTNEDHPDYHLYGGRGIKVSPAWVSSFDAFRTDMGAKPNGTTIDREDNNGDYTKKNCRWATHSEQANNKRTTVWIEALGKRLTLRGWETELSIPYKTLRSRHQMGWEAHRIVTTPHKEAA